MATSVPMLILGRLGVGVGEAGGTPPSHSLIANYFPAEKRTAALGIYAMGLPIGAMVAALVGGWVTQNYGWRMTFLALGIPGLLLAVLVKLTVREPERPAKGPAEGTSTLLATVKTLLKNGLYRHVIIACVIGAFISAGTVQFTTSFFMRTHGLELAEATLIFGVAQGIFATLGAFAGGAIVHRLQVRTPRAAALVPAFGAAACGLLLVYGYMASNLWVAIIAIMLGKFANSLHNAPSFAMMQAVATEGSRATAVALFIFLTALLGGGLGPLVVGAISDLTAYLQISGANVTMAACDLANANQPGICAQARASGLQTAIVIACLLYLWESAHFFRAAHFLPKKKGPEASPVLAK